MYTSARDLSEVGRAILSYKLLDPVTTRRWLKPFSFSTDPHASVGVPWGVRRINVAGQPYRWITAFNKAGRISDYSSVLAISTHSEVFLFTLSKSRGLIALVYARYPAENRICLTAITDS
jgi:hypothetical protein